MIDGAERVIWDSEGRTIETCKPQKSWTDILGEDAKTRQRNPQTLKELPGQLPGRRLTRALRALSRCYFDPKKEGVIPNPETIEKPINPAINRTNPGTKPQLRALHPLLICYFRSPKEGVSTNLTLPSRSTPFVPVEITSGASPLTPNAGRGIPGEPARPGQSRRGEERRNRPPCRAHRE